MLMYKYFWLSDGMDMNRRSFLDAKPHRVEFHTNDWAQKDIANPVATCILHCPFDTFMCKVDAVGNGYVIG